MKPRFATEEERKRHVQDGKNRWRREHPEIVRICNRRYNPIYYQNNRED